MKKLFTLTIAMAAFTVSAFAQISTGEPTAKVYRTGNRAQAGDFGLYLGAKTSMFKDILDKDLSVTALPLINLKYMATDQLEARVGIEFYQTTEKLKGFNEGEKYKARDGQTDFLVYPGVAYHFSRHNILDVYAGVEMPIGWNSTAVVSSSFSDEVDYFNSNTKRAFVWGLGAFVGLQAYIGKLPLAIGLEYGISSQFDMGLKYKSEITTNGETQVVYSPDYKSLEKIKLEGDGFDKLRAKKGKIGNQVRLTLTYYFK